MGKFIVQDRSMDVNVRVGKVYDMVFDSTWH